jgi:hypothetical protein
VSLITVNGNNEIQSKVYHINLLDNENKVHRIKVFGVDWISSGIEEVDVDRLKGLFSNEVQGVWDQVRRRPTGVVELLIGSNYLGLHPTEMEVSGNVKVMKSKFGSGYVLPGSHNAIKPRQNTLTPFCINACVRATSLSFKSVGDYLDSNELAVDNPRRCNNCMNCKECVYQGHKMSLVERFEYETMTNNVTYDEVDKVYCVAYPFMEDPSILSNDRR